MSDFMKKIALLALVLLVGFAAGRYSSPTKIEETREVKTDTKTNTNVQEDKNKSRTKITVIMPDGTKRIVERTKTTDKLRDTSTSETHVDEKSTKLVENKHSTLSVAALAGVSVHGFSLDTKPVYGAHVQKSILGPISLGAWGLSNQTGGLSLGLQF